MSPGQKGGMWLIACSPCCLTFLDSSMTLADCTSCECSSAAASAISRSAATSCSRSPSCSCTCHSCSACVQHKDVVRGWFLYMQQHLCPHRGYLLAQVSSSSSWSSRRAAALHDVGLPHPWVLVRDAAGALRRTLQLSCFESNNTALRLYGLSPAGLLKPGKCGN